MKDEATHFAELVACDGPTSEVAAAAILDWHSRFGIPPTRVSDSGSHFTSKVIGELNRRLKAQQKFTLAYTPWRNGSVERVNRDIIQVLKALILEFKVSAADWPYLLPLVQSSLNHSPVQSLANKAPIELFTGLPCPNTLDTVVLPGKKARVVSLPKERPDLDSKLRQLRASLKVMHKAVKEVRERQALRYRSRRHYEQPVNVSIGDYVLRSHVDEKLHANKLSVTWVGPYRVTASQGTLLAVEALVDHRYHTSMKMFEIKVKWQGLEEVEDSWEPLKSIVEDVPKLMKEYADEAKDGRLHRAMRATLQRKNRKSS
ncbi:hypothetical protein PR001_g24019 [Phytophthora rubi]|uniref:Integrase catalytic domain-containing protein n=1 Tax=Phytophthora rubi TaxID=129364 RepID=A0A6A3IGQ2_9STRA|nr:hypothetical protein PR001_g24019 [Phytophthora rubi]